MATLSRVFAREAALRVAEEGLRWVSGAADTAAAGRLVDTLPLERVRAVQIGLLADMDAVADLLYDRVPTDPAPVPDHP